MTTTAAATISRDPSTEMLATLRNLRSRYGTRMTADYVENSDLMVVDAAGIRMAIDTDGNVEADMVYNFRARKFVPGEDL